MANYTIELRQLVRRGYRLNLDSYPIFDESHRKILNDKIIQHYWFREIGQETPDRFNHYLGVRMNEIMPYYNELFKTTMIDYDPLVTEFFERTENKSSTTDEKTNDNVTAVSVNKESTRNASKDSGSEKLTGTDSTIGNRTEGREANTLRTDDLTEKLTSNKGEVTDSTVTSNATNTEKSDVSETTNSTETKTTDMSSTEKSTSQRTTNSSSTESDEFSDIPQTPRTYTRTTDPSTGVITETGTDYVTTVDNKRNVSNTTESGTVNTEGTNKGTETITTDNSVSRETNVNGTADSDTKTKGTVTTQIDSTTTNTGTVNTDETSTLKGEESSNKNYDSTKTTSGSSDSESAKDGNSISDTKGAHETKGSFIDKLSSFVSGRSGKSPAELISLYRSTILNIDLEIIQNLSDLFMEVF